ncbi:cation:proton antiporter [Candidatus Woesearchaeota archaeon]|nr:cation:proton antiporter [Candidatus Woesearchaeota archaeon]
MESLFVQLALVIILAVLCSALVSVLRQPLIIGYIIAGILAGPYFFEILQSTDSIVTFSHIGIAFLLFLVGMNLNPRVIKDVGKVAAITGIGQIVFTSIVGYFLARLVGFSTIVSWYVSIALTFSSTIIIMKLLSDKGEIDTLYGKIVIGFLIVQDIVAIVVLMGITTFTGDLNFADTALTTVLKGAGFVLIIALISKYVLPRLSFIIAKSQEFLMLFAIAWCFGLAMLLQYLNFSLEAGALVAGITLSISPYRYEISSRLRPLRDFFIVLFFIVLGAQISFEGFTAYLPAIIAFSLFILIGNPLIMIILMGLLGYTKRTSFMVGTAIAQISEFSLILIALGVSLGHLGPEILSFVTIVGLITIAGSTYFIQYAAKLYPYFSPMLSVFERKGEKVDEHKYYKSRRYDVILFGANRIGHDLIKTFKKNRKKLLIVDYNPEVVIEAARQRLDCKYGDANDTELLNELNFAKARMVISTVPDLYTNIFLIKKVRESNKKCIIIAVSHQINESLELYKEGATYVIMPHFLGGHHTSSLIERHGFDMRKFIKEKVTHLHHIKELKKLGHEHPQYVKEQR